MGCTNCGRELLKYCDDCLVREDMRGKERDALRADLEKARNSKHALQAHLEAARKDRDDARADLDAARAEVEAAKNAAWETGYATGLENGRAEQQSDLDAARKLLEKVYDGDMARDHDEETHDAIGAFLAPKRGG